MLRKLTNTSTIQLGERKYCFVRGKLRKWGATTMKFSKELIITGIEKRIKKDSTPYYLIHVLMDNAQTCSLMYKGVVENLQNIKTLQKYKIDFDVLINKYGTRIDVECIHVGAR